MSYFVGTYVNTLTMDVQNRTFEGATCHLVRVEPGSFVAKGSVWCYIVGDSFVVCKGTVVGTCPKEHAPEDGRNMRIARLPVHMRPRRNLQFAALSREAYDAGGHITYFSHLVTLIVTCDGWILGASNKEAAGAIDLSAIRFCTTGGVSLVDEVSVHTCDVAGTRLVTMQGSLAPRFIKEHGKKPLALLPESCRPACETPFIVAGASPEAFHLLTIRPVHGLGCGGNIYWKDGRWGHDRINFSGIMFEVAEDALQFSTLSAEWSKESLTVFVQDFQRHLVRRFGSIQAAWDAAFDTDESGSINFTEFGLGCKKAGYVGNATRLWAALDEDRSGEISIEELTVGGPKRLSMRPSMLALPAADSLPGAVLDS